MRITGLAAPYNTTSNQERPHRFQPGAFAAFAEVPLAVVDGHKTTPHTIGHATEIADTDQGLIIDAEVPDDLDITGLSWSVEVAPWEMHMVDGVQDIITCTLHRVALTRDPAFSGTGVQTATEPRHSDNDQLSGDESA